MHDPADLRPTHVRFLALALLGVTSASAYLARYSLSVASTAVEHDLGITHREMSWVFSAFMVGYCIGQIPGGGLGKRIGTRAGLAIVIAGWSIFTAWSAFSTSLIPLIASQFVVGLAQAGMVPISSIAVKDWFVSSRRGFPSSVIAAAMSAGGVAAMWYTGELLHAWQNAWPKVLLYYAELGLGWSIVFYLLFRSKPVQHPWINAAEIRLIAAEEAAPGNAERTVELGQGPPRLDETPFRTDPVSNSVAWQMATSLSVWALGFQWFFRSAGYQFFARWFPAFLQERYAMTVDESGFGASLPLLGVAVGSLLGGVIVDHTFRKTLSKKISRNVVSVISLLLCATCVAGSELCRSGQSFVALMAVGAIFSGVSMPTGWAATIDVSGGQTPLLFAVMNMAATAAGIVAPPCVGYLMAHLQKTGGQYGTVVLLHAAIYGAAAACWLLVNPDRPFDRQHGPDR
jgi:MFS family permease